MRRIDGLTDEQVATFEERIELAVRLGLQRVADQVAKRIADIPTTASVLVAADEQPPADSVPEGDGLPPGQPYVSPDDLATIPPAWGQVVAEQLLPIVAEVFMSSAGAVYSNMVDATGISGLPSVGSLAAEQYLAQARNTFDEIGDDLWGNARNELMDGFERGESIPQLAARVSSAAGVTARTGVLVARTQVIEASNAGSFATAQVSGLEMNKVWFATNDRRTRIEHLQVEAETARKPIPLNQPFVVGGYSAMFPAAPTLPPSMRYNCRCAIGYIMAEKQVRQNQVDAEPEPPLPGQSGAADDIAPLVDPTDLAGTSALSPDPRVRAVQVDNRVRWAYSQLATRPGASVRVADLRPIIGDDLTDIEVAEAMARVGTLSRGRLIVSTPELRPLPGAAVPAAEQAYDRAIQAAAETEARALRLAAEEYDRAIGMAESAYQRSLRIAGEEAARVARRAAEDAASAARRAAETAARDARRAAEAAARQLRRGARAEPSGVEATALPDIDRPPIRPELARARTLSSLATGIRAEAYRITGRWIDVDLPAGGSLATIREYGEGILRGLERFPDAKLDRIGFFDTKDIHYAEAGDRFIDFNVTYATTATRPKLLRSLAGDVEGWDQGRYGWLARGSGSPTSIALHEFGHIVDASTLGQRTRAQVQALVERQAIRAGVPADTLVAHEISTYATSDIGELIAEAFSDVMLRGPLASPLSREIFDLLEAEYRKGGFAVGRSGVVARATPAPAPLSKMLVKDLRALAAQRGISIPVGAKKADIVRLIEGGAPSPTSVGGPVLARADAVRVVGRDVTPEVRRRAAEIRRDSSTADQERRWEQGDFGDTELQQIGKLNGFDAFPTVATPAEVDQAVAAGWIELWRGVGRRQGHSAADVAEKFRTGAYEPGGGIYGSGYYTSVDRTKGLHFTRPGGRATEPVDESGLMRMALRPDARILDGNTVTAQETLRVLGVDWDAERDASVVLADLGNVGAARGWDAIVVRRKPDGAPGGAKDQYIILNRSAVIVERAPTSAVKAPAAELPLGQMTLPQLRARAKELKITVPPRSTKTDIAALVNGRVTRLDALERTVADQAKILADAAENGASAKALTARLRAQMRTLRLEPVDAAGNVLKGSDEARTVAYIWRRPGGDIRIDAVTRPAPAGFGEFERIEYDTAQQLARTALDAEHEALGEAIDRAARARTEAVEAALRVIGGKPTAAQLSKAGIKKSGTVSTRAVVFDPAKHDLPDGVTAAKVRVVEPGYTVTVDGQAVVVRKARVEAVAPPVKKSPSVAAFDRKVAAFGDTDALTLPKLSRLTMHRAGLFEELIPDAQLRQETFDALSDYGGGGSVMINSAVRFPDDPGWTPARLAAERAKIAAIDRAMAVSKLPRDAVVWRGMGGEVFGPPGSWPGDLAGFEWIDPAFFSTSASRRTARGFAGEGVLMRIVAPRGTGAITMSGPIWESEVLLQRGLKFRVVRDHGVPADEIAAGRPARFRLIDVEIIRP